MKRFLLVFFFLNTTVFASDVYHSISIRSSTLGKEDDYELKLGFSNVLFLNDLHLKYERENDFHYRGIELKTNKFNKLYGELYIDEAKDINEQWLYRDMIDILGFNVRVSSHWDKWKDPKLMGGIYTGIELELNNLSLCWLGAFDTDFSKDIIFRNDFVLDMGFGQSLSLYTYSGNTNFWQIKQVGNYRF